MRWSCTLLLVIAWTWPVVAGEPDKSAEPDALKKLVDRLGSRRHSEREAAMAALIARRSPASIDLLRKAATSGDLEVRRRARHVLDYLARCQETERVLRPQKIQITYKEVPVHEAVTDFARRTGLQVVLNEADRAKVQNRKVSLRTGETTVWDAFQQLCDKAGLSERASEVAVQRPHNSPYREIGGRQQVIWLDGRHTYTRQEQRLVLVDGKERRPTYQAGALRLVALGGPARAGKKGPSSVGREVTIGVSIEVEPRLEWNRLVSLCVEHAVDSLGQRLQQPGIFVGEDRPWNPYMAQEVIVVWDGQTEMPVNHSRQASIKLRLGEKPATTIKELRGTLSAEVEAPTEPLVTVNKVLDSVGKSFKGPEGSYVKVVEARREPSGQYRLKVEVKAPPKKSDLPEATNWRIVRINRMRGGFEMPTATLSAQEAENRGLALLDDKGQPFALSAGESQRNEDTRSAQVYTLHYQPRKDQGEPARFVFSGRRTVLIDVPFVLKHVPLP
ncbi:MAG: HEAT repeat domain-containing protein [Planctomycetes bacterium]|nr:HEAT repeat domain-containing protein [Planctomycetota bacterium]